ncbi:MAG: anti-sigma factor [Solirubrobacterales bacterium]|nr:anti-sigma factor [Solirubrobacterales bacterium]
MSQNHDCSGDAAAYALGALEPAEEEAFRRHLSECAICRDELAQFQHGVDTLPLAAPQLAAPRGLRQRVMAQVKAEPRGATPPRRARPLTRPVALAGLLLVAALAVGGGIELSSGGSTGSRVISAQVGDAQLRVSGDHGDLAVLRLSPPAVGRIYEMWIERGNQAPSPSTLFSVTSSRTALVGVPGSLHGVSAVLVTEEPAGGTLAPTQAPLIVTRLS